MNSSNTQITDRALALLRREIAATKIGPGETVALVYFSEYVDRDRKTLDGFRPGYGAMAWRADQMHDWRVAQLPDGTTLPFFARFKMATDTRYSIDIASDAFGLFSIDPIPLPLGRSASLG